MYKLMAFTSGCRFQRRTSEPRQASELVKKKDDKVLLTKAFKYVAYMSVNRTLYRDENLTDVTLKFQ